MDKADVLERAALAGAFYLIERGDEVYFYTAYNKNRTVSTVWYAPTPDTKPEKVMRFSTQKDALAYLKALESQEGFSHVKATKMKQFLIRNNKLLMNLSIFLPMIGMGVAYAAIAINALSGSGGSYTSSRGDPLAPLLDSVFGGQFVDRLENSQRLDEGFKSFIRGLFKRRQPDYPTFADNLPEPTNNIKQLRYVLDTYFDSNPPLTASKAVNDMNGMGIKIGASTELSEKMMIKVIILYAKGNDVSSYKNKMDVIFNDMMEVMNDISYDNRDVFDYFDYLVEIAQAAMSCIEFSERGKYI